MAWMQKKLVQAVGAVKDQTKIGFTKVSKKNNRMRDLDIAIVRATSHNAGVHPAEDDKYATQVFHIISNYAPESVGEAAAALTNRFGRTRRWVVALKCVRLLHRLLRVGNGRFAKDILDARAAGLLKFQFFDFKDDAGFAFVRAYSLFVDETLECQNDCLQGVDAKAEYDNAIVNLIDRTPKLQHLLDCAIACLPSGEARRNRLVVVAVEPVVRETFRLYKDICTCIATLLDNIFNMHRSLCASAFQIYKKAASQSVQLAAFYESCKSLGACDCSDYPTVQNISHGHIETWEEFMTGRPSPEVEVSCNEFPSSPSLDNRLSLLEGDKFQRDLITFDKPFTNPEDKNTFALALFSNSLETIITNQWEDFDSPRLDSWEVALDMSAASASASSSSSCEEDPLAASADIAPPSYVEMEDMRRKYGCMLQEQQFWQTYHNMGMHGFLQLQYYNPFCVPGTQTIPLGMLAGTHPTLQVYNMGGIA